MRFPETARVIYSGNPLEAVICQLRFPPILRIESEAPAAFQDRIRGEYPLLVMKGPGEQKLNLPAEIEKMLGPDFPLTIGPGRQTYTFTSEDGLWALGLTRGFISLTAQKYRRWEHFGERLGAVLEALGEVYRPSFYERIGLRYRDLIRRSDLNLKDVEWAELLKPHIAAELASSEVSDAVQSVMTETVISLDPERGQVRIKHGLVEHKQTAEICYLIDADFFTDQRVGVDDARERLDYFNKEAGRLFKWCIHDRLHDAMGPGPVTD